MQHTATTDLPDAESRLVVWAETTAPAILPVKVEGTYRGLRLTVEIRDSGHSTVNVWCRINGCDVLAHKLQKLTLSEAKVEAQSMADRLLAAGAEPRAL